MPTPAMNRSVYLGDGLYATHEGHQLVLYTHDGFNPTNTIYLEPEVWEALLQYIELYKQEARRATEEDS